MESNPVHPDATTYAALDRDERLIIYDTDNPDAWIAADTSYRTEELR